MSSLILSKPLPFIAIILAHLIWGANFVIAKITLTEIPTASLGFLRFAAASFFLIPFFLAETKKVHVKNEHLPKLIAIGITMITLNITFFFEGIKRTTAIYGSALTLIIPMISVLLGWLVLKEKIHLLNLGGVFMGFIGAVVIVGLPQLLNGGYSPTQTLGNILIILAAVIWVVGAIISRQMLKIYPSLTVTAIAFMVGTITFAFPALREYLQDPTWPLKLSLLGWLGLLYMILLSSISAYFLFEWGLSKVGVVKADIFQYIEPFIASVLAITLLGEQASVPFIIGVILISLGVFLGTLSKELHHRHKAHRV